MANEVTVQQQNIEKALRSPNPMVDLPKYRSYSSGDIKFAISCKYKSNLDSKVLKWAFKLAERNVGPYYKTCKLGWQPKVKQADLNKNWARYLIATNEGTKQNAGYCMFRFDLDYGSSVLYCYEMQVEEPYQRKGLGAFMLEALEEMAQFWKMEKLVLTVLKNNEGALRFYERKGFKIDDTSPDDEDYQIMSKIYSTCSSIPVSAICEE